MKRMRQMLAALLCTTMLFTMDSVSVWAASSGGQNTAVTDENTVRSEADISTELQIEDILEDKPETDAEAETDVEAETDAEAETDVETDVEADADIKSDTSIESETEIGLQAADIDIQTLVSENMLLSYLVFGSDYVQTPDDQYVLLGIGDGTYRIESAVLHYRNSTTGTEYEAAADTIAADSILFCMDFADESFTGSYEVTSVTYHAAGVTGTIAIADTGIDAVFGVNELVTVSPDAEIIDEEELSDASQIVVTDATGKELTPEQLGSAVESAAAAIPKGQAVDATGAGNLVIMLDPGHGGTDNGAGPYMGLYEDNLNLIIAQACKAELEKYSGVTVYMTRESDTTIGDGSQGSSLRTRVDLAVAQGADVLISLHNNVAGASASGAIVFYPNSSYRADIGTIGANLSKEILERLTELGLKDNGTQIRDCTSDSWADYGVAGNYYKADYYGLIRNAKLAGIPAIIVEHAFLSNTSDVNNFLSSTEKLQALGVADATGIAEYYNLKIGNDIPEWNYVTSASTDTLKLSWDEVEGAKGYYIYRSTSESGSYKRIAVIEDAKTVTYTDTELTAGETYYYKLRSYDTGGSSSSVAMAAYPLQQAQISEVTSAESGTLTVHWQAVEDVSGYVLYRSTHENSGYTKLATITDAAALTYTDAGIQTGTLYYYKIKAYHKQNGKMGYASTSPAAAGWTIAATAVTSISSQSTGGLLVEWSDITDTYRYQVYRSTSKNGTYKKLATVSTNSYTDTSATAGTRYYYRIRTTNRVSGRTGYGSYSSMRSGISARIPAITNVLSLSSTSVKVNWNQVSGANGYRIYRSNTKNGTYKLIKTIARADQTSYTDNSLTTGKTYYYKIAARNKVNGWTGYSELSAVKSGKAVLTPTIAYIQSVSSKKLKIGWGAIQGASGYQIYRSTSKNGTYSLVKTVNTQTTVTWTDTDVKAGKVYYYKLQTYVTKQGVTGTSSVSAAMAGRVLKQTSIAKTKAVAASAVSISWNQVTGAAGYQIYRSTNPLTGFAKVGTVAGAATLTYQDATPKTNTTYYYKVRAYSKYGSKTGYAAYSAAVSGKSIAAPTSVKVELEPTGGLKISWKKVSGAVKYRIYRKASNGAGYVALTTISSGSTVSYIDTTVDSGVTYTYRILAYNRVNGVTGSGAYSAEKSYMVELSAIMGAAYTTQAAMTAQMAAYYNAKLSAMQSAEPQQGYQYPSDVYTQKGAADIETFAAIVYEEATAEGVKPEVVFAQICNETKFLQFGGDVSVEQCNFAGLGATGGGEPGLTFASVTIGIRAEVQHLKAYASTEDLKNECVDPRFQYVRRGTAAYVEWLGILENPNTERDSSGNVVYITNALGSLSIKSGCGWATQERYGYLLLAIMNDIRNTTAA